ncbi:MAG: glycosyl hydrolase family 28-related protein [Verrucomicrobiota bacterium]
MKKLLLVLCAFLPGVALSQSTNTTVVASIQRTTTIFEEKQYQFLPISPPSDAVYVHTMQRIPAVDWSGFDPAFTSQMYAEMEIIDGSFFPTYTIYIHEDPISRDWVIYNVFKMEVWRIAPRPGYDPYAWIKNYFQVDSELEIPEWLRWIFDPAHIALKIKLVPEVFHADYLAAVEASKPPPPPPPPPVPVTGLQLKHASGGALGEFEVKWPDGFTDLIDIFATSDLQSGKWELALIGAVSAGDTNFYWIDQNPLGHSQRFFRAGNGSFDSDGDMLPNAQEYLVYKTDPQNPDTDGDSIGDGDETHADGTYGDTDGFLTDPHRPDTVYLALPSPAIRGPAVDFPSGFAKFEPPVAEIPAPGSAPAIAEWTRCNQPGDTMALTGEQLSDPTLRFDLGDLTPEQEAVLRKSTEGRDTRFLFFGQTDKGPLAPIDGSIQRLDGRQCAVTLPGNLPPDEMYLMWPHNESGFGMPIAINQAEVWWVGPDRVSAGGAFSVYGRNLKLGGGECHLYIEELDLWLTSVSANPYKADFSLPGDVESGTYTIWPHNGHGREYGWAAGVQIAVQDKPDWSKGTIIDVTKEPYNAAGDGETDDHEAIDDAFDDAESGDTVYFPAGTYLSSYDLFPPNGARILGEGMDSSIIQPHPNNSRTQFVRASDDSFFKDITFASDDNNMKFWYGGGSQRVTWENVRFDQRANRAEHDTCLYFPTADHLSFKDCEFYQSDNIWFEEASQIFFDRCRFVGMNDLNTYITSNARELSIADSTCANYDESDATNAYGWAIGRWIVGQGHGTDKNPMLTYFGGNSMTNLSPRFAAARFSDQIDSISGTQATFSELVGFTGYLNPATMRVRREGPYTWQEATISSIDTSTGTITLTRDWGTIWTPDPEVGDTIEICDYVDANSGEIFMTESLPPVLRANPVSATANTITFSSTPYRLSGHVVAIVDGRGLGQTRRIVDHTDNTLVVDEDWTVAPNAESLAIVGECSYRMVAYGNHFDGNPAAAHVAKRFVGNPAVQPYGMANDWIVDSNIMTDLRIGIADYLWMEPLGSRHTVTPNYFNYFANNYISNCYDGIWRNLRLPDTATQIDADIHSLGTMFRNNNIVESVHRAINCEQLPGSHTIPADIIYLSIFDGNTAVSNPELFYARGAFFNQIWVDNFFEGTGTGVNVSDGHEPVLHNNIWEGFSDDYEGELPGGVLELPVRGVDVLATTQNVSIWNSGTDPMYWIALEASPWLTLVAGNGTLAAEVDQAESLSVCGGIVSNETSAGLLVFNVDTNTASGQASIVVIANNQLKVVTVTADGGSNGSILYNHVDSADLAPKIKRWLKDKSTFGSLLEAKGNGVINQKTTDLASMVKKWLTGQWVLESNDSHPSGKDKNENGHGNTKSKKK